MFDSDDSSQSSIEDDVVIVENRHERVYRTRINFDVTSPMHVERFRLHENMVDMLLENIADDLRHKFNRNHAFSEREQILLCLRFLSDNGFYHLTGDAHGVHKSSICRVVKKVVSCINEKMYPKYVTFPTNPQNGVEAYFNMAHLPSVCGCIDGSLISIRAPEHNEYQYVDRHGDHSINILIVSGSDMQIYFCSARWPGSTHDARVLRNSVL